MPGTTLLTKRLADIAQSIRASGKALALLGLGSAGVENTRLDQYSDLDFFVIARPGCKDYFLDTDLLWLKQCSPGEYFYRNTVDGYKFLFNDGVFCEFAIFTPDELEHIPFTYGRVIWADPAFNPDNIKPKNKRGHYQRSADTEWILGEALTNLYTGMCRHNRGEKLSGMRLIQLHAVDRILDLIHNARPGENNHQDPYAPERRFEFRHPEISNDLASFCQGYNNNAESALAQLVWLENHYAINTAIAKAIRSLIHEALH
jgi:lincosamide nucleotidyltransferase B/F